MFIKISQLRKSYDTIVIGSGLSATLTAVVLQRHGQKVLFVDPNEETAITSRHLGVETCPLVKGFESDIQFLQEVLLEPIQSSETENTPITFEAGFKPFVGFGEQTPDFIDELDFYTQTKQITFSQSSETWTNRLRESFRGDHLTGYQARNFEVVDGQIKTVQINNHKIKTQSIVFCDHPEKLLRYIDNELLKKKTIKELGKSKHWSSLSIDIEHKENTAELLGDNFNENFSSMHVLMGNKDKSDPCWGRFFKTEEGSVTSQWMSLVYPEQMADAEYLGQVLKKIQKQLKRAYPDFDDSIAQERIMVHFSSHGSQELHLSGHQTLPDIDNLWVASQWVHPQKNLIGLLQQVRLTLAAMGFSTENIVSEMPAETTPPLEEAAL